jgi:hypothetical protein
MSTNGLGVAAVGNRKSHNAQSSFLSKPVSLRITQNLDYIQQAGFTASAYLQFPRISINTQVVPQFGSVL